MDNTNNYITFKETKDGFEKILKVVNRLLVDSELCLKNSRYATSASLSILALEEIAKADFFNNKIRNGEGITKKEWYQLTKAGSHDFKLNYEIKKKEKRYEDWSSLDLIGLDEARKKLGMEVSVHFDKNLIKQEIDIAKKLVKNFNKIKQECFYMDWNVKKREWRYFDTTFKDQIKNILCDFLFLEARRQYLASQLGQLLPKKPFSDYTDEDWEKGKNSEIRKQFNATTETLNKKMKSKFPLLYQLLSNFESTDSNTN